MCRVELLVSDGRLAGPVKLAIDEHLTPRHDRGSARLKGGKRKGGTSTIEGHMTVQAVSGRSHPMLTVYPAAN